MGYTLKANMVDGSKYGIKCPHAMSAGYITVHNTSNDASAKNEIAYMIGNNNQVSFHYAIDDIEVIQGIPEDRNTWNAGDGNGNGNRKSIAIEICYSASGGTRFIEAEKNAAMFIAQRLNDLGWGIDRVRTHKSWSGKNCPHRTLEMGWQRFLDMVTAYKTGYTPSDGAPEQPAPTPTPPAQPSTPDSEINFTYEVKAGGKAYPPVTNLADYAGVVGVPITDVAISVDKGSIWYQVHVWGGGWLPPVSGCDWTDAKNGYAGNGKPIDAIRVYLNTPADFAAKHGYKKAQYRLSPINGGYYSWQYDNETGNGQDGYAGCFGKEMDRFQVF